MRIRHMVTFSAVVAILLFAALLPAFGASAAESEAEPEAAACCVDAADIE